MERRAGAAAMWTNRRGGHRHFWENEMKDSLGKSSVDSIAFLFVFSLFFWISASLYLPLFCSTIVLSRIKSPSLSYFPSFFSGLIVLSVVKHFAWWIPMRCFSVFLIKHKNRSVYLSLFFCGTIISSFRWMNAQWWIYLVAFNYSE